MSDYAEEWSSLVKIGQWKSDSGDEDKSSEWEEGEEEKEEIEEDSKEVLEDDDELSEEFEC